MDGFTFFKSYYESAQHLSDKDQAQFYKLIMDYMFTGEEPQLQGHLMGFWLLVKPNLDTSKIGRNTVKYRQWRLDVFERDHHTCRSCGNKNTKLNAHHIVRWVDCVELRLEVDNGLTLCEPCHKEEHKGMRI